MPWMDWKWIKKYKRLWDGVTLSFFFLFFFYFLFLFLGKFFFFKQNFFPSHLTTKSKNERKRMDFFCPSVSSFSYCLLSSFVFFFHSFVFKILFVCFFLFPSFLISLPFVSAPFLFSSCSSIPLFSTNEKLFNFFFTNITPRRFCHLL